MGSRQSCLQYQLYILQEWFYLDRTKLVAGDAGDRFEFGLYAVPLVYKIKNCTIRVDVLQIRWVRICFG